MTRLSETHPQADVRLYTQRASYSFHAAREIFKRSPIPHVAFVHTGDPASDQDEGESSNGKHGTARRRDPTVMNEPLIMVILPANPEEDEDEVNPEDLGNWVVYFHTHGHSGLVEAVQRGCESITVTTTIIDGLIFSPTAHNHSLNYRSATLHLHAPVLLGSDTPVPSAQHEEKRRAMASVVDTVSSYARTSVVGQPTDPNVKRTSVVRCLIAAVSNKQRTGGFDSFQEPVLAAPSAEEAEQGWTGVVPCWTQWGELLGYGKDGDQVRKELRKKTDRAKTEAEASCWGSEQAKLERLGKKRDGV